VSKREGKQLQEKEKKGRATERRKKRTKRVELIFLAKKDLHSPGSSFIKCIIFSNKVLRREFAAIDTCSVWTRSSSKKEKATL
jgi:hypothetical protein